MSLKLIMILIWSAGMVISCAKTLKMIINGEVDKTFEDIAKEGLPSGGIIFVAIIAGVITAILWPVELITKLHKYYDLCLDAIKLYFSVKRES